MVPVRLIHLIPTDAFKILKPHNPLIDTFTSYITIFCSYEKVGQDIALSCQIKLAHLYWRRSQTEEGGGENDPKENLTILLLQNTSTQYFYEVQKYWSMDFWGS